MRERRKEVEELKAKGTHYFRVGQSHMHDVVEEMTKKRNELQQKLKHFPTDSLKAKLLKDTVIDGMNTAPVHGANIYSSQPVSESSQVSMLQPCLHICKMRWPLHILIQKLTHTHTHTHTTNTRCTITVQIVMKAAQDEEKRQVTELETTPTCIYSTSLGGELHNDIILYFQLEYYLVAHRCAGTTARILKKGSVRIQFETTYRGDLWEYQTLKFVLELIYCIVLSLLCCVQESILSRSIWSLSLQKRK